MLNWSWLAIWAPIGFCRSHSWVSFSRKNQLKRDGAAQACQWAGHVSSPPALSAPFLQAAPPDRQLFSFLFPWSLRILLTYFRFPFSVGKGNLGLCSSQLNPGPAGKEGASSRGHWVRLVNPNFLFFLPAQNHHIIAYTAVTGILINQYFAKVFENYKVF